MSFRLDLGRGPVPALDQFGYISASAQVDSLEDLDPAAKSSRLSTWCPLNSRPARQTAKHSHTSLERQRHVSYGGRVHARTDYTYRARAAPPTQIWDMSRTGANAERLLGAEQSVCPRDPHHRCTKRVSPTRRDGHPKGHYCTRHLLI